VPAASPTSLRTVFAGRRGRLLVALLMVAVVAVAGALVAARRRTPRAFR
jgi:hypothetical protein